MKKWMKRLGLILVVILILIVLLVNFGMQSMRFTDEDATKLFSEKEFDGKIEYLTIDERRVKVIAEEAESTDSILMVFIHGAPGSWDAFKDYLVDRELRKRVRMVAYDRPGYGGSGSEAMPGIEEQSEILKGIIEHYDLERTILVGHSYGGPIAGNTALDDGLDIDAAVLIAPLLDPENEPLFWYSYFSYWKLTSWLLPKDLQVAGVEKFAHAAELDKIKDKWKNSKGKIVHVHGLEDALAPGKENVDFSSRTIPANKLETIVYPEKGHLIIWSEYALMKEILLKEVDSLN